uniref:Uncharacterized protein n=1 Tax=Solanum lycopersicum TaxID=4081 RepID=K4BN79_SOLLC
MRDSYQKSLHVFEFRLTGDSVQLRFSTSIMDLNDLNKVWEVKKVRDDEARENVAKQSGKSSPANPSLLGLNIGGGAEVKIRLE